MRKQNRINHKQIQHQHGNIITEKKILQDGKNSLQSY